MDFINLFVCKIQVNCGCERTYSMLSYYWLQKYLRRNFLGTLTSSPIMGFYSVFFLSFGKRSVNHVLKIKNVDKKQKDKKNIDETENTNFVVSKEVLEYISSKQLLLDILPHEVLKRKRKPINAWYLVDDDVAQQFVNAIESVWNLEDHHVVVEANPGLGLVSRRLMDAGVKRLLLYEKCTSFQTVLTDLQNKYPNEIKITSKDIFSIWKVFFQDKMDYGSRVEEFFNQLPKRNWTDDPVVKIIGASPSKLFLKHLILSIVYQTGLLMHGRPELYLAMYPSMYIHLTCRKEAGFQLYRSTSILFQLFFETKFLAKLPREAFLPWETKHRGKITCMDKEIIAMDQEYVYLIKVVPKKDLHETVAPVEKLQQLWYFIHHHFFSRRKRVIPELEKWIPGCGSRLILQGMNIFTQFGDLSPQEMLKLFQEFSSWPEYPHSTFLPSMEMMFLKMEQTDDDYEKDITEADLDTLESMVADEDTLSVKSSPENV